MKAAKKCVVKPGARVNLTKIDPNDKGGIDKEKAKEKTAKNLKRIAELQELLYAGHQHSLLVCLVATDTGGKDGVIKTVGGGMNPQGCKVASFKAPTELERDHDFLWRVHGQVPAKGEVTFFNRSHYEDVLIVRVRDLVPKKVWKERYRLINAFEEALESNGTHVLKFFLHISQDEQLERFRDRFADPTKNWKLGPADFKEREKWEDYQKAYEAMLSKCSTKDAPFYIIPANRKWLRDYLISEIVVDYLEALHMPVPATTVDLKEIATRFAQEDQKAKKKAAPAK